MKQIFLKTATSDDFKNAEIGDWVEGVGDISTHFALNFVHAFGEAMQALPAPTPQCPYWTTRFGFLGCHYREIGDADTEHDNAIRKVTLEKILPTDEELKSLKSVVCYAFPKRIEGYNIADNYYHKLKSLCAQEHQP